MEKYLDGLDEVASALASRGRRQIVARLERRPATSSELAELLGIGLPATHKHLALLTHAGLLHSRKTGRVVTHRLEVQPLRRYDAWLAARTGFWTDRLDALAAAFDPVALAAGAGPEPLDSREASK